MTAPTTMIGRPADGLAQPAHTEAPDLAAALDAIDLQLTTDSPEVVLVAEIERLTGEPTEDEIDRAADVLAAHGYRVTWDWYPFCTCGWRADQPCDVASYDRHVARAALRAARGRS